MQDARLLCRVPGSNHGPSDLAPDFQNEDSAKSGLEPKRILKVEGVCFLSAPHNFLVQLFRNLDQRKFGVIESSIDSPRSGPKWTCKRSFSYP